MPARFASGLNTLHAVVALDLRAPARRLEVLSSADGAAALHLPLAVARYTLGDIDRARLSADLAASTLPPLHPDRAAARSFAAFLDRAYGPAASESRAGRRIAALTTALALHAAGDVRAAIDASAR